MNNQVSGYKLKPLTLISILIITTLIITIGFSNAVQATSWAELDADDVIAEAEVIVIGKYDLSERGATKTTIFLGETFKVKGVYKGEATKTMSAGINVHDYGWVNEFQVEGGEFLLFLEENTEQGDFLVPVGGPNGMIQILEGKVIGQTNKNKKIYEKILKEQSTAPLKNEVERNEPTEAFPLSMIVSIVFLSLVVFSGSYWFSKNRKLEK